jgi:hypothetical protein
VQLARPVPQINGVISGREKISYISELYLGMQILSQNSFDKIFFTHDESREIENRDSLPPLKLAAAVLVALANDAVGRESYSVARNSSWPSNQ